MEGNKGMESFSSLSAMKLVDRGRAASKPDSNQVGGLRT